MKKVMMLLFVGLVSFIFFLQLNMDKNNYNQIELLTEDQVLQEPLKRRLIPEKWNGISRKIVYLTFDDGPSKNTEAVLNILDQYEIKATFFVIGTNVIRRPEVIEEINARGHYIGLHTMSHDKNIIYDVLKPEALTNELLELQVDIFNLINKKPTLLRPPYGSKTGINKAIADSLVKNHFKVWDWNVDSMDWHSESVSEIINRIQSQTNKSVEIVLMHEKDISVEALPQVIEYYVTNGYEFRTYNPEQHFSVNFLHDDRL